MVVKKEYSLKDSFGNHAKKWAKRASYVAGVASVLVAAGVHGALYKYGHPELKLEDLPDIRTQQTEVKKLDYANMTFEEVQSAISNAAEYAPYGEWFHNRALMNGGLQKNLHMPENLNLRDYLVASGEASPSAKEMHEAARKGKLVGKGCNMSSTMPCAMLSDDGYEAAVLSLAAGNYFEVGHKVYVFKENGKIGILGSPGEYKPAKYDSLEEIFPNVKNFRINDLSNTNYVDGKKLVTHGLITHLQNFYDPFN